MAATTLAQALGMSIKSATILLDRLAAVGIASGNPAIVRVGWHGASARGHRAPVTADAGPGAWTAVEGAGRGIRAGGGADLPCPANITARAAPLDYSRLDDALA